MKIKTEEKVSETRPRVNKKRVNATPEKFFIFSNLEGRFSPNPRNVGKEKNFSLGKLNKRIAMVITTIIATATASLASPADVAQNLDTLLSEQEQRTLTQACGSKLEDATKVGVSVNYTYTFIGSPSQRMDDSNSWD